CVPAHHGRSAAAALGIMPAERASWVESLAPRPRRLRGADNRCVSGSGRRHHAKNSRIRRARQTRACAIARSAGGRMEIKFRGMSPLLNVFDMPSALRFYRDILGFAIVSTSGGGDESDWVWLQRGGVDLMLNTAYESHT